MINSSLNKSGNRAGPAIPFIVAVTGHRELNGRKGDSLPGFTETEIQICFRELLKSLANRCSTLSEKPPMILLSCLADGADQIAAEVALELGDRDFPNLKVAAVLPMEKEIYLKTIDKKKRFLTLLARSHEVYTVPLVAENVGKEEILNDHGNANWKLKKLAGNHRAMQYAAAGQFLCQYSHTLFAFWDGIDASDKIGGTSSVVRFKLEGDAGNFLPTPDQMPVSSLLKSVLQGGIRSPVGPVVQLFLTRDNEINRRTPLPDWQTTEFLSGNNNASRVPVLVWTRNDLPSLCRKDYPFKNILSDPTGLAELSVYENIFNLIIER